MNTGDKLIVEGARDAVWGIGFTPHQAITTNAEWFKGANNGIAPKTIQGGSYNESSDVSRLKNCYQCELTCYHID